MFVTGGTDGDADGDSAGVVVAGVLGAVVAGLVGAESVCLLEQAAPKRRRTAVATRILV
jgi:outer membrane lipoprotein SlyB